MDKTLMFSRQANLVPAEIRDYSFLLVGLGAIGSNVAHMLASMGVENMTFIDPDNVAEENLYPGYFRRYEIGKPKVQAVANRLRRDYGIVPDIRTLRVEDIQLDEEWNVAIIGTDSLRSRRQGFHYMKGNVDWWIDGRIGFTSCSVYAVRPDDEHTVLRYREDHLRGGESPLPCGMKATSPITKGWVSGMVGQVVFNIVNVLPVPFFQLYDLKTGLLTTMQEA